MDEILQLSLGRNDDLPIVFRFNTLGSYRVSGVQFQPCSGLLPAYPFYGPEELKYSRMGTGQWASNMDATRDRQLTY
jgi:hypothetical protein